MKGTAATGVASERDDILATSLLALAEDRGSDRVRLDELVHALGDGAPAALALLFALPNIVPMPPGTASVLGLPLLVLTLQMAAGRPVRLPAVLGRRSLPGSRAAPLLRRAAAWLAKDSTRRLGLLVGPVAERATACFCVVLAVLVVLPIPFSNAAPALAIWMCALGLLREDGRWVLGGLLVGVLAIALVGGALYALARLGMAVLAPG